MADFPQKIYRALKVQKSPNNTESKRLQAKKNINSRWELIWSDFRVFLSFCFFFNGEPLSFILKILNHKLSKQTPKNMHRRSQRYIENMFQEEKNSFVDKFGLKGKKLFFCPFCAFSPKKCQRVVQANKNPKKTRKRGKWYLTATPKNTKSRKTKKKAQSFKKAHIGHYSLANPKKLSWKKKKACKDKDFRRKKGCFFGDLIKTIGTLKGKRDLWWKSRHIRSFQKNFKKKTKKSSNRPNKTRKDG